ncbi:bifunctional lysylphosphatidylglycerol flippase/synthetase MprF [Phyllobacterium salinisoli]|uniref:Bifunctional lysylphosphatidylglycerol flippase/synthetase MprF n=1 Tax=Phyllobacterium salinisoli TaxID=1899321 RepID=A0A368K4F8_9HYPH|nr:bifunctional lysylphosphatidylglycerol flippase/synthetase MprF [Phyllobacterium salinisoli]RCS24259.1 bifunctional lysylphosphatidylglycerol flippase/synthetase MprF [Phyllobacterium salinisoli]
MGLIDDNPASPPSQASDRPNEDSSRSRGLLHRLKKYQHIAFPIAGIVIALLALFVLEDLLRHTSWAKTVAAIENIPLRTLGLALFFTALSYAAVALYDVVAVDTIAPGRIPHRISAIAGAAGYAISNALGFSLLTGGALRYRIYAAEGISLVDIGRIVGTSWFAIWFAFIIMIGAAMLIDPADVPWLSALDPRIDLFAGVIILGGIGWLIYWLSKGDRSLQVGQFTVKLPTSRGALIQIAAGLVDVTAAAATLYMLMPEGVVQSFAVFALVYVIAVILGVVSHAPGGLGAFEATMIAGLGLGGKPEAIAALIVYRLIYTVLPLLVAVSGVLAWEAFRRREKLTAQARLATRVVEPLIPGLAASVTFLGGIVLLISGVTPGVRYRLDILSDILPLIFVEMSHLAASFVGVALLVVARGLAKRLARAWVAAMILLLAGAVFSLAKGLDWEEASILCVFAGVLWAFRRSFYRRPIVGPFVLTWNWLASVGTTVLVSTWLGFFIYRHVEYSDNLWWDFAWNANAPRFLRATVLVLAVILVVSLNTAINGRGMKRSKKDLAIPDAVPALVAASPHAETALALLGDKQFLMDPDNRGFIMYAQSGGSLIALGEPVGDRKVMEELAWSFHALADKLAARTVFYGVGPHSLPLFLDMGLIALKLGEVARVDLREFSLDGPQRQPFRYADRRADKDGLIFEIIPAADVPPVLPQLKKISDAWLAHKSGSEKRFSLGFFNPEFLSRYDVAVMKKDGDIVAFANVWRSADKNEITVDLMRYMPNVSKIMMDALFAKLLMYSKAEGYRWFNLGAAPLSGLSGSPLASRWNRFGSFLYKRGADFYHFDGLKAFKEKFDPVWSPHYLICPGGLDTPRTLVDVTTLINGSPLEFIRK